MEDSKRFVNRKELKGLRRTLRRNLTPTEAALWSQLKAGKLDGISWRRQFSVGDYILDFYCPKFKICIELDGASHYTMQGDACDLDRTEFLNSKGIRVIRFENKEIWNNIDEVLDVIREYVSRISLSVPLLKEGRAQME
ncbi:MAG: endonuclease domain-containing protein [Bacteroidaceae bacterium]|nr:endonuclease domain-containing protein [Bacteroidaceae bacterium]